MEVDFCGGDGHRLSMAVSLPCGRGNVIGHIFPFGGRGTLPTHLVGATAIGPNGGDGTNRSIRWPRPRSGAGAYGGNGGIVAVGRGNVIGHIIPFGGRGTLPSPLQPTWSGQRRSVRMVGVEWIGQSDGLAPGRGPGRTVATAGSLPWGEATSLGISFHSAVWGRCRRPYRVGVGANGYQRAYRCRARGDHDRDRGMSCGARGDHDRDRGMLCSARGDHDRDRGMLCGARG
ncbi:MAG: hypothetical protein H6633_35885, partial [Anaerolineales bacterium]|nr:hypothetical protein [Anaerolineales bacterium]